MRKRHLRTILEQAISRLRLRDRPWLYACTCVETQLLTFQGAVRPRGGSKPKTRVSNPPIPSAILSRREEEENYFSMYGTLSKVSLQCSALNHHDVLSQGT